ncbi:MAG: glycosyltransferase family 61 protein [Lacipirellulaceae bacterium]
MYTLLDHQSSLDPHLQASLWKVGKYLLPRDLRKLYQETSTVPKKLISVNELANDDSSRCELITVGTAEALAPYEFPCSSSGTIEQQFLNGRIAPPAWVARLENGHSVGRHCLAMTADGTALRETGFNLDMQLDPSRLRYGRHNLRRRRFRREGDLSQRRALPAVERIRGTVATLNTVSSHNFYHWMVDILPRWATLHRAGFEADYYLIDCQSQFQRRVLQSLGIREEQLIQPHCGLNLQADELLVPSKPSPECQRTLAQELCERLVGHQQNNAKRRIFISRRNAATRRLANEQDVEKLLTLQGFETHLFEEYDLATQCRLVNEAEVIVATHGAGLANLQFARPGTRVIEIIPAGRYNATCYPTMSRVFGLSHRILFAERARWKQILTVSLEDLSLAVGAAHKTSSIRLQAAAAA